MPRRNFEDYDSPRRVIGRRTQGEEDLFDKLERRTDNMIDHPVRTFFFGALAAVAIWAIIIAFVAAVVLVCLNIAGVI